MLYIYFKESWTNKRNIFDPINKNLCLNFCMTLLTKNSEAATEEDRIYTKDKKSYINTHLEEPHNNSLEAENQRIKHLLRFHKT